MATTHDILDFVADIAEPAAPAAIHAAGAGAAPPAEESVVHFRGAGRASLPAGSNRDRWLLETLRKIDARAFVEVNDEDERIVRVAMPIVGIVTHIIPEDDDSLTISLDRSAAGFTLSPDAPHRHALEQTLQEAYEHRRTVAVVHDLERHEITHVFEVPEVAGPGPAGAAPVPRAAVAHAASQHALAPEITPDQLRAFIHDDLKPLECGIPPADLCIPFLYVADGCWARAHRVCQLLAQRGFQSKKVWIFPKAHDHQPHAPIKLLLANTDLSPTCKTRWGFHVATLVEVKDAAEPHVIDPSLFFPRAHGTLNAWLDKVQFEDSDKKITDSDVYMVDARRRTRPENQPHNGMTENERTLRFYEGKLFELAHGPHAPGRPPYARCQS